ncbi:DUF6303 family protein [Streptomyces sp. NPDC085479]|uniref:DUF6303 family protein n=1 Tax=Streptomyces sp. NPDC085479 TaxID=3365726 RepID=UPI0037CF3510
MSGTPVYAQLSLRCCGTTAPEPTDGPCWQLYVAKPGSVGAWPTFTWPTSREVPPVAEREAVLGLLGYGLAEGAEWVWTEDTGPEYHSHPVRVSLIARTRVQPLAGWEVER